MSCDAHRSEIRDLALGAVPSKRLEAHLVACAACRGVLEEDRRRLAEVDDEIGRALAVEPPPSLLPRVREVASRRQAREAQSRLVWLLPLAASFVALAVLIPLARRTPPVPGRAPLPPSPAAAATQPTVSGGEAPLAVARPQVREESRRQQADGPFTGRRAAARPTVEPEVIVPLGGEAALRRYVQAIRHRRVGHEVVLGLGPDPVDWSEPPSILRQPGADRLPGEAEPAWSAPGAEAVTLGN